MVAICRVVSRDQSQAAESGAVTYTVASLAREWDVSEGLIRKLIANGELGCFRLGTLIRIPAEEVARFQTIPSSVSRGDTQSSGTMGEDTVTDLRPLTALERRLRQGAFGRSATSVRTGPWG